MSDVVFTPRRSPRKKSGNQVPSSGLPPPAFSTTSELSRGSPAAPTIPPSSTQAIPIAHLSPPTGMLANPGNGESPSLASTPYTPQFNTPSFYPPYGYPVPPPDVQGGPQAYHYSSQWAYQTHPYFHGAGGHHGGFPNSVPPPVPPPSMTSPASGPAISRNAPAPPPAAAFGIDPSRLAAPPSYISPSSSGPTANPPSTPTATSSADAPAAPALGSALTPGETTGTATSASGDPNRDARPAHKRRRGEDDDDDDDDDDAIEDEDEDGNDDDDGGSKSSGGQGPGAGTGKREVPSKSNPCCDYIEGAGTGEMKENQDTSERIYRTRDLPHPYFFQAEATRHYRRTINDVLTRVESVASRSGCYAYIAIQHPDSGGNFYYYASRKLLLEAPEDTKVIHKTVGGVLTKLMKAYKATKVDLQGNVDQAVEEARKAKETAAQAERKVASAEEKVASLEAELKRLKAAVAEPTSEAV